MYKRIKICKIRAILKKSCDLGTLAKNSNINHVHSKDKIDASKFYFRQYNFLQIIGD